MPYTHEDESYLNLQPDALALINYADRYLAQHGQELARKYSPEEYFTILLANSVDARKNGTHGIAAAVLEEEAGLQLLLLGHNYLFSKENPHGHAETNAIKARTEFRVALQNKDSETILRMIEEGRIHQFTTNPEIDPLHRIIRPASHTESKMTLYTTLEPCLTCNEKVTTDPGIQNSVIASVSDNPENAIPAELQELLIGMFFENRDNLYQQLVQVFAPNTPSLYLEFMKKLSKES